jgi:Peptidase family C25
VPVFITTASGLQSAYGPTGCPLILNSLNALVEATPGASLRILDDSSSMQGGTVAASLDPTSLCLALRSVYSGGLPDAVVIIGDQRIVPPFSVPNPVDDRSVDPDPTVSTDNPYGYFTPVDPSECIAPPVAVGRIAGGIDGTAGDFLNLLNWQLTFRNQKPLRSGYVEVTSWQWQNTSGFVLSSVGTSRTFVSPDAVLNSSNASNLDCRFLYCNLHGFPNQAAWMGFDPGLGYPVTAITPDAFQSQFVSGTIVLTEACYGLFIGGKATRTSCALSLLASGAAAIVGSTGLAFGTASVTSQDLIDADALAQGFFNTALQPSQSVGACLRVARAQLGQTGSSDPFVKKTLLAFQLLGDPTYVLS